MAWDYLQEDISVSSPCDLCDEAAVLAVSPSASNCVLPDSTATLLLLSFPLHKKNYVELCLG